MEANVLERVRAVPMIENSRLCQHDITREYPAYDNSLFVVWLGFDQFVAMWDN